MRALKKRSYFLVYGVGIAATVLLTGCLHLLAAGEVNQLTTCKNTDLKAIKKSLLLAGYDIKREDADNLTTEYKQTSGYSSDRVLRRITVVKLDDKSYKFNVRVKSKRIENNSNSYSSNNYGNNSKKHDTNININMNTPIETENEFDQSYYKEHVGEYEQTKQEVCGYRKISG